MYPLFCQLRSHSVEHIGIFLLLLPLWAPCQRIIVESLQAVNGHFVTPYFHSKPAVHAGCQHAHSLRRTVTKFQVWLPIYFWLAKLVFWKLIASVMPRCCFCYCFRLCFVALYGGTAVVANVGHVCSLQFFFLLLSNRGCKSISQD